MPYRSTGITICGTRYDRRQKLTPEQRAEIFHRYMTEDVSQRQLAREYGKPPPDYVHRESRKGEA